MSDAELLAQLLEALAVLGDVDRVGEVPQMGTPPFEGDSKVEGRLAAKLDDDAYRLFCFNDVKHVLAGKRFEVEPVAGVVVGGDGLGVGVDHDRLEAVFRKRKAGVTAAVVELDALADAVGAAPRIIALGFSPEAISDSEA